MLMGSMRPRYRSAELEISKNGTGFLRAEPKLGQEAQRGLFCRLAKFQGQGGGALI